MTTDDSYWFRAGTWAWDNWEKIETRLGKVYSWFRKDKPTTNSVTTEQEAGILIIGPGGVGKTTLARLLSGEYGNHLFDGYWQNAESISQEHYSLSDDKSIEVVIPPGQKSRREATWLEIQSDITNGKYRGVVLVVGYGYHSYVIESYKTHPLYQKSKKQFLENLLNDNLAEELRVLQFLKQGFDGAAKKIWLFVVVTKQDLWWDDRDAVKDHYTTGDWQSEIAAIKSKLGVKWFRNEIAFTSLVIRNFETNEGQQLKRNTEGYDQKMQSDSLKRVFETVDGLREWEG